ncbi:MAG: pro-sigmaK processing inhibitor BofA family protein [Nanoarchaeota archaeon]|nr:pro-sigmaK processing inhibitor BofA family protein [DPANN group archaeon]MBL7116477.1 pro-sigmaK processing inhibitor BofA family protein [Nanoarchaeota archaeon]
MIVELAILIIVAFVMVLIFKFFKKVIFLILNSIVGLLALFGFNSLFNAEVSINIWSVLVAGIGGSIGFVVIIILHYLGLAF